MQTRKGEPGDTKLLAATAIAIIVIGLAFAIVRNVVPHHHGGDFEVYRASGNAVIHNKSVYSAWMATQMRTPLPFTYPPLAAVAAVPFTLVGRNLGLALWTIVAVVLLVLVVRTCARPFLERVRRPAVALTLLALAALALTPVQDELGFGQVGIILMAMCLFDCALERPPWPRGVLVGAATAIKLIPGIFIPYLWVTGRRRAAIVAAGTAVALTLAGSAVTPGDSKTFWTSRVFDNSRVGGNTYFSNQSVNGILQRALGADVKVVWIVCVAAIAVYGLRQAMLASRRGQELLGISLTALTGIAVSPVSWIHHLVWLVPALLVLLGNGTDRRRVAIACALAAFFTLRVPYLGEVLPHGWGYAWVAGPLKDSYGLACVALLVVLPRLVTETSSRDERPQPAPAAPTGS